LAAKAAQETWARLGYSRAMAGTPAARQLRIALEEFYSGLERARLARARQPEEETGTPMTRSARWLFSQGADEAWHEAAESGEVSPAEAEWLRRHLRHARHALEVNGAGRALRRAIARMTVPSGEGLDLAAQLARLAFADDERARALSARELEHALRAVALEHVAAHARAEQPLLEAVKATAAADPAAADVGTHAGSGLLIVSPYSPEALGGPALDLPAEPWLEHAAAFLAETDAAADDAVQYCLRAFKVGKPIPWHLLLRGLRAPELDSDSGRRQRWQRASAWLRGLGFERELQRRVRAEVDHADVLPLPANFLLSVPLDVRVAQIPIDYGVVSDACAAEGVARALGHALCLPLAPELCRPLGPSVAGALGALGLQVWGERTHLQRVQHMAEPAAARVGRLSATFALLSARAAVALSTAPAVDPEHPQSGMEALAEPLSRALCCEVPPSIAGLLGADRVLARARALEALTALALYGNLRERFDLDWFRNPRSAELLRSACERGNTLGPAELCAELGAPLSAASGRALELVSG
jgi:hypothetical protein